MKCASYETAYTSGILLSTSFKSSVCALIIEWDTKFYKRIKQQALCDTL